MVPYLQASGFYGVALIGFIQLDYSLITSLVERWRPETHTFHIPDGECTITLEDVEVLLGLPIDGHEITGSDPEESWRDLCENLLGLRPNDTSIRGNFLKTAWLMANFDSLPDDAEDEVVQYYTRAYILKLLAGILIPTKATDNVHLSYLPFLRDLNACRSYSWGSAILAHVYRALCKASNVKTSQIGGCMTLVQLWAWERFKKLSPKLQDRPTRTRLTMLDYLPPGPRGYRWVGEKKYGGDFSRLPSISLYRSHFDSMLPEDFAWMPYRGLDLNAVTPGREIWRTVVPLICFEVVEWHQPDRVMRQFGMQQFIPRAPLQHPELHKVDRRKNISGDWVAYFYPFIQWWQNRRRVIVSSPPINNEGSLNLHSEYMTWYRSVTRKGMTPIGAGLRDMVDLQRRLHIAASPTIPEAPLLPAAPNWRPSDRSYSRRAGASRRTRGRAHGLSRLHTTQDDDAGPSHSLAPAPMHDYDAGPSHPLASAPMHDHFAIQSHSLAPASMHDYSAGPSSSFFQTSTHDHHAGPSSTLSAPNIFDSPTGVSQRQLMESMRIDSPLQMHTHDYHGSINQHAPSGQGYFPMHTPDSRVYDPFNVHWDNVGNTMLPDLNDMSATASHPSSYSPIPFHMSTSGLSFTVGDVFSDVFPQVTGDQHMRPSTSDEGGNDEGGHQHHGYNIRGHRGGRGCGTGGRLG